MLEGIKIQAYQALDNIIQNKKVTADELSHTDNKQQFKEFLK